MFSKTLEIMDENTVQYMIDELQAQVKKERKEKEKIAVKAEKERKEKERIIAEAEKAEQKAALESAQLKTEILKLKEELKTENGPETVTNRPESFTME